VVLAGAASAVAFLALAPLRNLASLDHLSVPVRLAICAYGLGFYLWKTIAPVKLSPLYELRGLDPWATPFLLSYVVVLFLTALAWALRRRVPGLATAWLAFVVILFPVLGVFQNGAQIAADRYTYLAGLGWAVLAGAGLLTGWPRRPVLLTGAAVGVLLGLAALTWTQVRVWHDSQTLWTHALAIDPNSPVAENHLGWALARHGNLAEAIEHYRRAVEIWPDYAETHYDWGTALARQGRLAEAIEHYRQALEIKPDFAVAHSDWGAVLLQQGKLAEAIEHYQQALQINPDSADAHANWGVALLQQGKPTEAIDQFRRALRIKSGHAEAHANWGAALAQQGQLAEAIEHYQHALRIKPDLAEAHVNFGVALAQQGKLTEAIEHYKQALAIRPDLADAHSNWGNALAVQGRSAEAIEHYQQALRLKPDHAGAQTNLANALRGLAGEGSNPPLEKLRK
jgi:tetratricopeptide (TPR) repeat protein